MQLVRLAVHLWDEVPPMILDDLGGLGGGSSNCSSGSGGNCGCDCAGYGVGSGQRTSIYFRMRPVWTTATKFLPKNRVLTDYYRPGRVIWRV